jgi:HD-like signal output (HDOD) protein
MDMAIELTAEVRKHMAAGAIELPTYPGVALKVQKLVRSSNYGLGELTRLVEADQALAVNTMRAANSAFYRSTGPVTTLQQAITRIGAAELSNIAIAGTLGLEAASAGPLAGLRRESWRRSLVGAALAQGLAKGRGLDPEEAFLAGLLCDFGETIAYACFEGLLESGEAPRPEAEWRRDAEALSVELGVTLAAAWKLPPLISEVVVRHRRGELEGSRFPGYVALIHSTCALASRVLAGPAVVGPGVLDAMPGLSAAERSGAERQLPTLPGLLQAFDEASPEVAPGPSAVTPAPTSLPAPVWPADLPVSIAKRGRVDTYRATALSAGGVQLTGRAPQPERYLVTLEFGEAKFAGTVRTCEPTPAGFLLEVHHFAMGAAAQVAWTALLEAARAP